MTSKVNGLSDRMMEIKDDLNLSYRDIQKITEISKSMWSSYRDEINQPSAINLYRIGKYLGISVDWLLGLSDKKYISE